MPTYTYRNARNEEEIIESTMSLSEMEALHEGFPNRDNPVRLPDTSPGTLWLKSCAYDQAAISAGYYWESRVGLGDFPKEEIPELQRRAQREKGFGLRFTNDGVPFAESKKERNNVLDFFGYGDKDAGYGDRAPQEPKTPKEARPECERTERDKAIREMHAIAKGY